MRLLPLAFVCSTLLLVHSCVAFTTPLQQSRVIAPIQHNSVNVNSNSVQQSHVVFRSHHDNPHPLLSTNKKES